MANARAHNAPACERLPSNEIGARRIQARLLLQWGVRDIWIQTHLSFECFFRCSSMDALITKTQKPTPSPSLQSRLWCSNYVNYQIVRQKHQLIFNKYSRNDDAYFSIVNFNYNDCFDRDVDNEKTMMKFDVRLHQDIADLMIQIHTWIRM